MNHLHTIPIDWAIITNVFADKISVAERMAEDKEVKEDAAQSKDVASVWCVLKRKNQAYLFILGEKF